MVCRVEFKLRGTEPVPVWEATVDAGTFRHRAPVTEIELWQSFDVLRGGWPAFRDVSCDRLPAILATGIDVGPTTAPIFVSDFDKAGEYGGWPKVIMALDGERLDRTYREIPPDTGAEEGARLMLDYPNRTPSLSGECIWLTRLPATDPRAATAYEIEYARWIPGNPFDALQAVFVFIPEGDSLTSRLAMAPRGTRTAQT